MYKQTGDARMTTAVTAVSVADARSDLAELLNRVAYGKERLVITRHGREVAAIVPVDDLKLVSRLRRFVARKDVSRALEQLDTGKTSSWERLRSELGL
jgi:prevent-host-death family protein